MFKIRCFLTTLLLTVLIREPLHVLGTHQCLTWDVRNDEHIRFICRVSNFAKPVTLTDNHSKLFAECTFFEKVTSCQPSRINTFVRVNYTTNEVVFYVERYNLWEYDGKWSCHVGRKIFNSDVSISKGIVNNTNVRLESSFRKPNMIELKCLSCRVPVSLNAEFHINGISEENVFYDRGSGKCMHNGKQCRPDVCGCSALGNEFSILFKTNTSTHKSFACDLMFLDPLTGAKFSKIASIELNGTGYIQTKTKTKIIKHGKPIIDKRVSFLPGNMGMTVTTEKDNTSYGVKRRETDDKWFHLQWISIGLSFVLVVSLVVLLLKKKCRRQYDKRHLKTITDMSLKDTNEANTETLPLINDGNTPNKQNDKATMTETENTCTEIEVYASVDNGQQCEPCLRQGKRTGAKEYCINCNELYCWRCRLSHSSMKMTSSHAFIYISYMFCLLHGKGEYTHICHRHKILICVQCLDSDHVNCRVDSIIALKTSNDRIKLDDISLMRSTLNQTSSTPNLLDLFKSSIEPTDEKPIQAFNKKNYFQNCMNAAIMLKKEEIQTKSRISFKSRDRELSFFGRKMDERDFFSSV